MAARGKKLYALAQQQSACETTQEHALLSPDAADGTRGGARAACRARAPAGAAAQTLAATPATAFGVPQLEEEQQDDQSNRWSQVALLHFADITEAEQQQQRQEQPCLARSRPRRASDASGAPRCLGPATPPPLPHAAARSMVFTFETMLAMAVARAMAVNSSIRTVVAHHSVLIGRYWVSFGSTPVYVY